MNHHREFLDKFWQELGISFRTINNNTKPANKMHLLRLNIKTSISKIFGRYFFYLLAYREAKLRFFISHLNDLAHLYSWLGDDYSKSLLVKLLVRKIFNYRRLTPLIDTEKDKVGFQKTIDLLRDKEINTIVLGDKQINLYDLSDVGYPITAHMNSMNVVWTFMSEQYKYLNGNVVIQVETGDTVIDAGGCWGDTALYMAFKGAKRVYCFEFVDENLIILKKNLVENSTLAKSISVIEKALWREEDVYLSFQSNGPASTIVYDTSIENRVQTITIDAFVDREGIDRIDFIKMDIEGAELDALTGAQNTIKRFAPKLAITVYHKPEDLCIIPHILKRFRTDYVFYLDHFTLGLTETVLFAIPMNTKLN